MAKKTTIANGTRVKVDADETPYHGILGTVLEGSSGHYRVRLDTGSFGGKGPIEFFRTGELVVVENTKAVVVEAGRQPKWGEVLLEVTECLNTTITIRFKDPMAGWEDFTFESQAGGWYETTSGAKVEIYLEKRA